MKQSLKVLVLGCMAIGALAGCDWGKSSGTSQESSSHSSVATSSLTTSSDVTSTSSTTSISSSSTASNSSVSTSSSTSVSPVMTGISLTTDTVKKEYEQGEALDLTGLVVTAKYSDNTTAVVTDYTSNPANGTVFTEIKEETITISYNNFSETFKVNVIKASKKAWTTEEAKIMSDHLNGQVLPFTGFEESVVSFDTEEGKVLIQGGQEKAGYIAQYVNLLTADGYEPYKISENGAGLEKEFTVENGVRHVYVFFMFKSGQFYLEAYDPYLYEYPASFATFIATNYFSSEVLIPAVEADFYAIDDSDLFIYCYKDAENDDAGYGAVLTAAGWTIQDEKDADDFYVAISPDGTYAIAYLYEEGVLMIYFTPVNFWNKELVKAFFEKYNGTVVDIPALNVKGGYYQFIEYEMNEAAYYYGYTEYIHATMFVYGSTTDDLPKYKAILEEESWTVTGSDNNYSAKKVIGTEGIARIEFNYDTLMGCVEVIIYFKLDPIPETNFPATKIAELLGEDITDVVPAYTGANGGFTILDDEAGTAVMVYVEAGTENDAVAAYKAILLGANYTEAGADAHGDMRYISEHGQILVTPYYGTSGSFTIAFRLAPLLAWPAAQIASAYPNAQDTVPAVEGALEYVFQKSGRMVNVSCTFKSGDDARAALAAFIGDLEEAKYTLLGLDGDGDPHYNSENGDFEIRPYISSSTLYVTIMGPKETESLWPIDKLTEWYGEDIANAIPAYDKGTKYEFFESYAFNEIMVTVEDAEAAVEEYVDILTTAGFTTTYEDELGDTHYCKGNIDITPWAESDTVMDIDIIVDETPTSKWPTQDIASLLTAAGYTDTLPAYDDECDAIEAGTNYDGSIYILIETTKADTVFTAYKNLLVENYFVYDNIYSTYTTYIYKSPNNQYTVSLYTNRFGVEIDIKKIENGGGQTGSDEFPMDDIRNYFPTADGVLPILEDENASFEGEYSSYDNSYSVLVTFATEALATAAYDTYIAQLKAANFAEEAKWGGYATVYYAPDNSFVVWVIDDYLEDGEIYIDIYPADYFD